MAGYTTLCETGWYANEVGCSVGHWIDDFIANAEQAEAAVNQAITDLAAAYDANIETVAYENVNPGAAWFRYAPPNLPVRSDYSGLAPDEVVLPERAGLLTPTQSDAIFARGRARVTRAHLANVRAALEQPASLGIGMASPALMRRVAEANQKKAEATTQVALEQAAQEGAWEREDIKTILAMELQNFKDKWAVVKDRLTAEEETLRSGLASYQAQIQSEGERRGWAQMEITTAITEATTAVNTAIQWGRITLEKLMQAEEIIVKMKAAVFQAWLQSASLSMSFSASQSLSSSTTN